MLNVSWFFNYLRCKRWSLAKPKINYMKILIKLGFKFGCMAFILSFGWLYWKERMLYLTLKQTLLLALRMSWSEPSAQSSNFSWTVASRQTVNREQNQCRWCFRSSVLLRTTSAMVNEQNLLYIALICIHMSNLYKN